MLLNGSTLNGAALNGSAGQFQQQQVAAAQAYTWALRVLVGGVDRTADLTGSVQIDREEGAAGIAQLSLYLAESPVVPTDWIGRSITIDYLSQWSGGAADVRRFTGQIAEPVWSPLDRVMACQCIDNLQQRVEALTIEEIDALIGGRWSSDLFDPTDGRSRWDYAQERLQSLPASIDCSPLGELRVTSWFAQSASYVFGQGTTIYQSVGIDLPLLSELTNVVEIECDYRFPRLHQRNQSYDWVHPGQGGLSGINGFCVWRPDSTELPDVAMVESAASGGGLTIIDASYNRLPATNPDPCGTGAAWINNYPDLLLGCSVTAAERWVQQVTEQYRLRVVVEPSIAAAGEVIARERATASNDPDQAEAWTSDEITDGITGHTDLRADTRRSVLIECLLHQASTTAIAAHRASIVSWSLPTSMAMAADLVHTLDVDDQGVHARGKCCRVVDAFDLDSGSAITSLSIAVMRGGEGVGDPLTAPAGSVRPQPDPSDPSLAPNVLPTQLGGRNESPIYDDAMPGFAGNYDNTDYDINPALEQFPRRFDVPNAEVVATDRDEEQVEITATYRLSIPNDTLELS